LKGLNCLTAWGCSAHTMFRWFPNPAAQPCRHRCKFRVARNCRKTPPNESVIGIDYRLAHILPGGAVALHADWRFTADTYNDAQNSIFLYQPAYNIGNASIAWEPVLGRGGRFECSSITLPNRRYIVSGDKQTMVSGFHEAEFNRPREWGALPARCRSSLPLSGGFSRLYGSGSCDAFQPPPHGLDQRHAGLQAVRQHGEPPSVPRSGAWSAP